MIKRKESFTCSHCSEANPVIPKNERNHCRKCLYSLHVDQKIPGDREANCKNLMAPIYALVDSKKEYIIMHQCTSCGHEKRNRVAADDSREKIAQLILNANKATADKAAGLSRQIYHQRAGGAQSYEKSQRNTRKTHGKNS